MHHHTLRPLAAALAFALASGACVDAPTSPAARTAGTAHPGATLSPSGATLIPATVKYRDNGGKPATGRSGSAALRALALLGKNGRTDLEYWAFTADPDRFWIPATMTRAQIKALDADSTHMFTRNENGLDSNIQRTQLGALARGQYLIVQANVKGPDPHRTDVVTVTQRVKLRPDLAVRLDIAPELPALRPIPIEAVITELNGDMGASTQCILRVNGSVQDYTWGVWIDAGDAVTCAFTHTFPEGSHAVQVELGTVFPGDWDTSNNRSEVVQVQAVRGASLQMNYYASASASRTRTLYQSSSQWYNPATQQRGEDAWGGGSSAESEHAFMTGFIDHGLSGEVAVEMSQSTDGRVIHAESWTTAFPGCAWRFSRGSSLHVCSSTSESWANTWFSYSRHAGSVTYHSMWYSRVWDAMTGEDLSYYHENWSDTWHDGVLAGLGDSYAFRVRLSSSGLVLTANSEFPLVQREPYSYRYESCGSYTEPWDGFTAEWCDSMESTDEFRSGSDSRYQ
jgi:hypothetical protein